MGNTLYQSCGVSVSLLFSFDMKKKKEIYLQHKQKPKSCEMLSLLNYFYDCFIFCIITQKFPEPKFSAKNIQTPKVIPPRKIYRNKKAGADGEIFACTCIEPVSYTHLTLPTILLV